MDQTGQNQTPAIENPRGAHEVSVDSKGRLKLPSTFKGYFETIEEKSFFVTTIDRKLLYIYPLPVWRQNERTLASMTGSPEEIRAADAMKFLANHFGDDATMDGEGRILIPQELRKQLGLNDSKVRVTFENGKIVGFNAHEYQKKMEAALADIDSSVTAARLKGFL